MNELAVSTKETVTMNDNTKLPVQILIPFVHLIGFPLHRSTENGGHSRLLNLIQQSVLCNSSKRRQKIMSFVDTDYLYIEAEIKDYEIALSSFTENQSIRFNFPPLEEVEARFYN